MGKFVDQTKTKRLQPYIHIFIGHKDLEFILRASRKPVQCFKQEVMWSDFFLSYPGCTVSNGINEDKNIKVRRIVRRLFQAREGDVLV